MNPIPEDIFRPESQCADPEKSILILTADKTEDTEFFYPYYRFIEEGYRVDVATPEGGAFKGKNGSGLEETKKIADVRSEDYDLLYIPGGKAPAKLKKMEEALALTRHFFESNKPIAALCHGPQVLAAAHIIEGRKIAGWPEIENEIVEAGGKFIDQETVIDGPFITARWPGDLPAHLAATLEALHADCEALPVRQPSEDPTHITH